MLEKRLRAVEYLCLPGDSDGDGFDVVGWAIRLEFEDAAEVYISWAMIEGDGFLEFARHSKPNDLVERRDVSARWSSALGDVVIGVEVFDHDSEVGPLPYGVEVKLRDAGSIFIALGERGDSGQVFYMPDSLVISTSAAVLVDG